MFHPIDTTQAVWYILLMTKQQFETLTVGDILISASGKPWRVTVSEDNPLEPSGHYVFVVRSNEQGTNDGLTNREKSCGVAIRVHTAKYELLSR